MTQALTGPESGLSRAEQATLIIGQWVEQEEPGAGLGTRRELQERVWVSKGTINEAVRLLESLTSRGVDLHENGAQGRSVHCLTATATACPSGACAANPGRRRRRCRVRGSDS